MVTALLLWGDSLCLHALLRWGWVCRVLASVSSLCSLLSSPPSLVSTVLSPFLCSFNFIFHVFSVPSSLFLKKYFSFHFGFWLGLDVSPRLAWIPSSQVMEWQACVGHRFSKTSLTFQFLLCLMSLNLCEAVAPSFLTWLFIKRDYLWISPTMKQIFLKSCICPNHVPNFDCNCQNRE